MIKVVLVRGTQDSTPKRQKVSNSSGGSSGSFPNIPHVGAKAIRLAPSEGVLEVSRDSLWMKTNDAVGLALFLA